MEAAYFYETVYFSYMSDLHLIIYSFSHLIIENLLAKRFDGYPSKFRDFVIVEFTFDGINDLSINIGECKFAFPEKEHCPSLDG